MPCALSACATAPVPVATPAPAAPVANACELAEQTTQAHLAVFDTLDFDVFTHQHWDRLRESHADGIVVHWPDGHQTIGLARHIADLKAMFVYAPDTRIEVHPVKFGSGAWTSVYGVMEGTFSAPMPTATGAAIQPTGKHFKLPMATIGHWIDGVMDEEYLFWDNASYLAQLGVGG
ncbi:MAG: ester cyclase [Deltaproteobacteria bacterium]|nr:ester cyclase [Deltaproteobacteria bacterium]